jgi:hypothetical protein
VIHELNAGDFKMSKIIRLFAAFVIGTFALAACSDSSGTGTGLLTLRLTDAPFPFDDVARVDVYVIRVDAKTAATTAADAADEADHTGWTTITDAPIGLINLLELNNGKTINLGAATLATGNYRSFRLILDTDKSSITLKDDPTNPPIFFPSAGQTGIKVILDEPIQLTEDGTAMTLDFDIGRSFVMRGNTAANGFNFKPVIRAVAEDIAATLGSVTGSVHANSATGATVPGAAVEVLQPGSLLNDSDPTHIVQTTTTTADGNFRVLFLIPNPAGSPYVLRATPPAASGFKPALLPGGLTITAGTATEDQIIVVAP